MKSQLKSFRVDIKNGWILIAVSQVLANAQDNHRIHTTNSEAV